MAHEDETFSGDRRLWPHMYALFYEHTDGRREWILAADDEHQAKLLARSWSRGGETPVVVVQNKEDGETVHISTFCRGRRTLDS